MTEITFDDIRAVLGDPVSEVSDADLQFDKSLAEGLVTDELDPYSDNTGALEDVAALLGAAFYQEEGTVGQLSQGSQQVSFTEGALSYWRKAKMRDPTGRLKDLESGTDFWSVTL